MKGRTNGKPFVKGDPRINRKGRPKGFDDLRDLARSLAEEKVRIPDGPYAGQTKMNAEIILRNLMKNDGYKFLEIAFGKVPAPIEVSGGIDLIYEISDKALPKIEPRPKNGDGGTSKP